MIEAAGICARVVIVETGSPLAAESAHKELAEFLNIHPLTFDFSIGKLWENSQVSPFAQAPFI